MKDDKKAKVLTPLQKILANENYLVAAIFVIMVVVISSVFLVRKFVHFKKKLPTNATVKKVDDEVKFPDYRMERELMRQKEMPRVDLPEEDTSYQRVNDDLQRIKEEQEMEKLDRLQERLNDTRY